MTPEPFDYVGVYLPEQNLYLTPTLSAVRYNQIPFMAQGKQIFLPQANQFHQLPQSQPADNQPNQNRPRADINLELTTSGYYSTANKINYRQENPHRQIEILLDKHIQNIFGKHKMKQTDMSGVDELKKPFQYTIKQLTVPDYAQTAEGKLTFRPFKFPLALIKVFI